MHQTRMMNFLLFGFAVLSFSLPQCSKSKPVCEFQTDPAQIKVEWTAFKTTAKTPVKGRFNTAQVSGNQKAETLAVLAKGLKMEIDGASIETDNPGRNATIQQFFFEKFSPSSKIEAEVTEVSGDGQTGTASIRIRLNGAEQTLPFTYQVDSQGAFSAVATITLPAFNLQVALDSLHQACADQHVGADGVSKTWDVVDLKITGKVSRVCR